MNEINTVQNIETITSEILEAKRLGGQAILTIGKRLMEAKAMLPHGDWLPWLNEKVEFSESTAQRFMRLAREWSNPSALADLGASKALALLALPSAEREEFLTETHQVNGEEKSVIDMTSRELEKAIKERDDARKAAEQAQAEAKAKEEARQSMEESLKTANELLDRARTQKELADGAVSALEQELAELKAAPVEVAVMELDQKKLDAARAEGEASKAEELAKLQKKLDKAQAAQKKAEDKQKEAESSVEDMKRQLEEAEKKQLEAAVASDPDTAKFEVYFNQAQEVTNKLRGLLLKARGRDDQSTAEKLSKALIALSDQVRRCAE